MSLLTIATNAARALNISIPTTVIGNTDLNAALLLRLAQEEGEELCRRHDWQALTTEKTFTTLAATLQPALPADFDHMLYDGELWNRTQSLRYVPRTSSRDWQTLQVTTASGIIGFWRLWRGGLYIYPAPTAGETAAYEYQSNYFVDIAAGGSPKATWTIDTDVGLIPERLMTLGIIWRWKQIKGMAYAEELATYERELERAAARDRGAGIVQMPNTDAADDYPPTPGWPGTITP